ncbi:unnamed protein product [Toxocara canis]|nr:unnamed protein product [Toxocara canis]
MSPHAAMSAGEAPMADRAQQAALMVRPRRLSDSSVSSACSDSDSNAGTTTLPHVRSQTDRVETSPGVEPYTLRSSGDVRHLAQPSAASLRSTSRGNPTAAYFKSPIPQRRNTSGTLLDSGSSRAMCSSSGTRKASTSGKNEHSHSTQSMGVCEATSVNEERSPPSLCAESRSQPTTPKQQSLMFGPTPVVSNQRFSHIPVLRTDRL